MKKIKSKFLVGIVPALTMLTGGANVFAANPYNIEYTGGVPLGSSNVQINPDLTEDLTALIKDDSESSLTFSNSQKWQEGYFRFLAGRDEQGNDVYSCDKVKYVDVYENNQSGLYDNLWYTVSNGVYTSKIEIKNIYLDGLTDPSPDKTYAIGVTETDKGPHGLGWVVAGWAVRNEECTEVKPGSQSVVLNTDLKIYVETDITLTKKGLNAPFTSSELYFGITDIDQAQSFKILNANSALKSGNMYAENAEDLQPDPSVTDLKNIYVVNGDYIYSQYNRDADPKTISIAKAKKNNIYVKTDEESQRKGLNVVFGFASAAGSGIQYFAKMYTVNYKSDDGGVVTGNGKEEIIAGDTLTGGSLKTKDNYVFKGWIADVDVTLNDGTVIKAGQLITNEQVTKIVANKDINLTAQHIRQFVVTYEADKNGTITGETTEKVYVNGNPTGTTQVAKENYVFANWVADVEVTLTDGSKIAAGKPITEEQLKKVVVNQDIKFTAVYSKKDEPIVPDTGVMTQNNNSVAQITVSIIGIAFGALLVGILPFVIRRKVDFKK